MSRQVSRFPLISLRIVATNNFFYFFVERCNENIKEKRLCRVSRRTFIFSSSRDISWIFFFASLVLEIRGKLDLVEFLKDRKIRKEDNSSKLQEFSN